MNMRTKSTAINQKVKKAVFDRDSGCCIFCGKPITVSDSCAHIVPRSAGGLGREQNIVSACFKCHNALDQTTKRNEMLTIATKYLASIYGSWSIDENTFKKGVTK